MITNLSHINDQLVNKTPNEIIDWAISLSSKRIITTSFGKYSSVLLNAISKKDKDAKVIWCDTGYNTQKTYEYAINLINKLKLNIHIYSPLKSKAYIDTNIGLPKLGDPEFDKFTEIIKLEPFKRALKEHQPEVWFTNIRADQTEHRSTQGILSFSKEGILKVSPFYHWTEKELDQYIKAHGLTINNDYYDITKVLANRECGIHFQ